MSIRQVKSVLVEIGKRDTLCFSTHPTPTLPPPLLSHPGSHVTWDSGQLHACKNPPSLPKTPHTPYTTYSHFLLFQSSEELCQLEQTSLRGISLCWASLYGGWVTRPPGANWSRIWIERKTVNKLKEIELIFFLRKYRILLMRASVYMEDEWPVQPILIGAPKSDQPLICPISHFLYSH